MKANAYSLIEVLVAIAVLLVGIAAAAVLINAIITKEAADANISQALNMQEQAARLWQLGLDTNAITNILPSRCTASNPPPDNAIFMDFSTNADPTGIGVEKITLRAVFRSGLGPGDYRTNDIVVVRPSIR